MEIDETTKGALVELRAQLAAALAVVTSLLSAGAPVVPGPAKLRLMKMAHAHLGVETVDQSRVVRRAEYGVAVRSSANLFGTEGSGAILYRAVKKGTRVRPDQAVRLTERGRVLAEEYQALLDAGIVA